MYSAEQAVESWEGIIRGTIRSKKGDKGEATKEKFRELWFQAFRFGFCVPLKAVEQALVCVGEVGNSIGIEDHFQFPGLILSNSSSITL